MTGTTASQAPPPPSWVTAIAQEHNSQREARDTAVARAAATEAALRVVIAARLGAWLQALEEACRAVAAAAADSVPGLELVVTRTELGNHGDVDAVIVRTPDASAWARFMPVVPDAPEPGGTSCLSIGTSVAGRRSSDYVHFAAVDGELRVADLDGGVLRDLRKRGNPDRLYRSAV